MFLHKMSLTLLSRACREVRLRSRQEYACSLSLLFLVYILTPLLPLCAEVGIIGIGGLGHLAVQVRFLLIAFLLRRLLTFPLLHLLRE